MVGAQFLRGMERGMRHPQGTENIALAEVFKGFVGQTLKRNSERMKPISL